MSREEQAQKIAEKSIEIICRLVGGAKGQTIVHEMMSRVINQRARASVSGPDEKIDPVESLMVLVFDVDEAA